MLLLSAAALACAAAVPASTADGDTSPPDCEAPVATRLRLDHVPIAVRDLEAAKRAYGALGFSFKPGYPHPNTLLNQHVKFADGSALELITASEPRDSLAAYYLAFLAEGEGGAFLSLDAGAVDTIAARIGALEPGHRARIGSYADLLSFPGAHPLRYLFFITVRSRPADLPEHLSHANTAARLAAVWLTRADPAREAR
ncbi:MAG TPA: VOC family protein, partial [Longimicrobium sp.]|nr:VOC family protein [Longimicrobium sp.]